MLKRVMMAAKLQTHVDMALGSLLDSKIQYRIRSFLSYTNFGFT